ncbi:MAG: epoxyqueuosine reductase QueH [Candidatus Omnitrophica bacterium]|nr:epoxyqueuosine reductase QueH [Candidatus Omnitrophota bacterium]
MKILLHICCAPCAVYSVMKLKEKYGQVKCFFYNPNIHPVSEYHMRRSSCLDLARHMGIDIVFHKDYMFEDFFRKTALHEKDSRCGLCWSLRIGETAEYAAKNAFDGFTSTLFISPYQDHEMMKQIAEDAQKRYSVPFIYEDFRPGFRKSHSMSRDMGLYHQKYCGCIYSERERFMKTCSR